MSGSIGSESRQTPAARQATPRRFFDRAFILKYQLRLGVSVPFSQAADAHVYTKEDFERHQRPEWSGTDEAQTERLARCQDTLELLFGAAARAEGDPPRQRLPGLMDSFMQWCERAREDFKLGPALDEKLGQRRFRAGMTQEYRDWRAMARGNPEGLKQAGFTDDPSRGDREELRLELDLAPGWAPGRSMKPPRPAVMILAPPPTPDSIVKAIL